MSLLGHDAIGHWALGHPPDSGASTTTLSISASAYAITSFPITFKITEAIASAAFAVAGTALSFKVTEAISASSYAISGKAISFTIAENIAPAAYTITGFPVNEIILVAEGAAQFKIVGYDAKLLRTGFDYDFQQGGVGHLLYEIEEAKRLAAITKRGPPGFVDLRSAPKFAAFGGQPAPPAAPPIDLQAIANQRAQIQAKKRREAEAILLLAS